MRIDDLDVRVLFDVDYREHRRREPSKTGLSPDWRELEVLAALPFGLPVAWSEVDMHTRLMLDTLQHEAVHVDAHTVTRCWRPATRVLAVEVAADRWESALHEVSSFATVAPRLLHLNQVPDDAVSLRIRAERLGVAVYAQGHTPLPLTGPPSRRYVREAAPRWEVAELVYQAWLAGATAPSTTEAAAC